MVVGVGSGVAHASLDPHASMLEKAKEEVTGCGTVVFGGAD